MLANTNGHGRDDIETMLEEGKYSKEEYMRMENQIENVV